jgi:hypothetical protein
MKTAGTVVVVALACVATVASSPPQPCEETGIFHGSILEGYREEFTAQPSDGSSSQLFKGAEARAVLSKCTEIDVIFGFVSISDDFYPALKKVGFIGPYNFFDPYTSIEELNGFESVEELGDVVGFQRITGLNNVKQSGSIRAVTIDGLQSLERAGSISASETAGLSKVISADSVRLDSVDEGAPFLPNIEELTGNLVMERGTRSVLSMPTVRKIRGSVSVSATSLTDWQGFAPAATIGGNFVVYQNTVLSSLIVNSWLSQNSQFIQGEIVVCKNNRDTQDSCPNNFVFQEPK